VKIGASKVQAIDIESVLAPAFWKKRLCWNQPID